MYPAMFRKMHNFTLKVHTDYVPTVALLHPTEMVIKVMTEVKIWEDIYLVKSMSQCIKGLPPSVSLAKRGRRLLFQGQLLRVRAGSYDAAKAPEESSLDDRPNLCPSAEKGRGLTPAPAQSSYSTPSSAAVTPSSPRFPSRGPLPTLRSKLLGSSRPSTLQEGSQFSSSSPTDSRSETTQLGTYKFFVFTDCVVVAGTTKSRSNGSDDWTLLENVGIGGVLAVTELLDESNSIALHSGVRMLIVRHMN
ncbi:hypothetical protein DFH06DRAFT_1397913 [Mycena polygramma]|nr:hypothetical protein DFH06DRAFT_1397913 [Mycena polygramma]